jgi:AraC-like DNA-binding protein
VPAASAPGRLAFPYLRTLAAPGWPAAGEEPGGAFTDIALDLAAGALRAVAGHHDGLPPRGAARLRELQAYALAHLGDPGLSPRSVARASYISVRQLHRLFARDGLSFAAWAREQRLRRCRDDLADPRLNHLAISGIAERWGYRSQAHFTRAFPPASASPPASSAGYRANGSIPPRLAWLARPVLGPQRAHAPPDRYRERR